MKKIILGFDPGTEKAGWALLEADGLKISLLQFGHIAIRPSMPLQKRLGLLYREASQIIEVHKPMQIAIEGQFVGINPKAAMAIAMSRGVLLALADHHGVEAFEYSPSEAKRGITGRGNATKEEVQKMCKLLFRQNFEEPFDATDAIALAYCHLNRLKARIV
ncbi:MAG: crossover junction endodeoxyribonuclease RuvC [Chlamydiae bacterium]|nr:crossover junction endodeoxyribonuclease RuvC [Chlamydiota bacterium]